MDWSFTSVRKWPLLMGFNWKRKDNWPYYCTICYPILSWRPLNSIDHKELPYDTIVFHLCRWFYVGSRWHGCIHQRGSSFTKIKRSLGWTIPRIDRISWYGKCCGSIKCWKKCWHLWSVCRRWGMSTWWTREKNYGQSHKSCEGQLG